MTGWISYLLRVEHMLIMCAVAAIILTVQAVWPRLAKQRLWVRLLPVLPIAGCSAMVWVSGLVQGSAAEKFALGIVLGSLCGHAYKIAKQTLLGNDKRIRDHPARL